MKTPSCLRLGGTLAVTALALLFGGCQNVNTYENAESRATPTYAADKRVVTDNTLAGTVRVVSINQATVSGNLLKIQATVENLKSSVRTVNYKFEWTDQDGMATNGIVQYWQPLVLAGRETVTVSSVAISPKAVDFKLKLVEAN